MPGSVQNAVPVAVLPHSLSRAFGHAREYIVKGPQEPFYFYDPWDTSPKFSHDPTGVATAGRYTVRFEGYWEQMVGMARGDAGISLVELA